MTSTLPREGKRNQREGGPLGPRGLRLRLGSCIRRASRALSRRSCSPRYGPHRLFPRRENLLGCWTEYSKNLLNQQLRCLTVRNAPSPGMPAGDGMCTSSGASLPSPVSAGPRSATWPLGLPAPCACCTLGKAGRPTGLAFRLIHVVLQGRFTPSCCPLAAQNLFSGRRYIEVCKLMACYRCFISSLFN